jgi:nucleoside-diphosphate-sugar epimerase
VGFGEIETDDENGMATVVADTRRLREEVGWQARRDLASGIAASIRWWQSEREQKRW